MMTRQELEGHWNQVKGSLREKWADLKGDDLDAAYGDMEQLIGVVQEKTGKTRSEIENFVEDIIAEGTAQADSATDKVRHYANEVRNQAEQYTHDASEYAKNQYENASHAVHDGYENVQGVVRKNPLESIAVTFGAGLIAGVIIGLTSSRRG
ncbi:CsbD family protein [Rubinisphaera italica]|uniref:CsbD-like domain-containing protein n=1 Tax=Rubinisphaera italica TaxID=2527969 RepID=A0A5C5XEG3_9PLAN|nr:CsbD family protein [Rubinisphaera italica]TWT61400.1 hypothetical protein Pan54_21360 [Rubinisphaera italica]HBN79699.1 hypothetical protein [Planctomycetaceae bacterium]